MTVDRYESETYIAENVYFDLDHYSLRPEAKEVLKELAGYLNSHDSLQVELHAYADDQGGEAYNMVLTQKRGQAVLDFLTRIGVDQTSLAIVAKGRQKVLNLDRDMERQFNRRVEFYINGSKIDFVQRARCFILRRKTDWESISQMTGVSVEMLKKLNGASDHELQMYQPVRIPLNATHIPDSHFFTGY
jgi:hypothetical protein